MLSAEDTRLVNTNPVESRPRKIVRVATFDEFQELASMEPDKLELVLNNWHGRKKS